MKARISGWLRRLEAHLAGKEVTVYPSYAYRDPGDAGSWLVPMRVWVHDNRDMPFVEAAIRKWAVGHFEKDLGRVLDGDERTQLQTCLEAFIADDKGDEAVEFRFDADPSATWFRFERATTPNGVIEEAVRIPDRLIQQVLGQSSRDPWLGVQARTLDGHGDGAGVIRVLEPEGLCVISDIDDTIKVTQVPAGKKTVLRNTFLHAFRAVDGMRERFTELVAGGPGQDVSFHYVSGSPWQLAGPLSRFLFEQAQFPLGTLHMKNLRKNLLEPGALDSIVAFALGGDLATLDQKVRQITNLMVHLPRRRFVLFGDSGEKDPEVYRAIKELFPEQVQRIVIRDVLGARLAGMERIDGPEVWVGLDTSELVAEMRALVAKARSVAGDSQTL